MELLAADIVTHKASWSKGKLSELFLRSDDNRDGRIDFIEFCHGIYGCEFPTLDMPRLKHYASNEKYAQDFFNLCDHQKDGYLDPIRLKNDLEYASEWLTNEAKSKHKHQHPLPWPQKALKRRIKLADKNHDKKIDFEEFCGLIWPKEPTAKKQEQEKAISDTQNKAKLRGMLDDKLAAKELFHFFDADGSGAIDQSELREMLILLNVGTTHGEVLKTLAAADTDGSGLVEYPEFYLLMYGEPCPEEMERMRQAEERKLRLGCEAMTEGGQKRERVRNLLKYLGDYRYYKLAFELLDSKGMGVLWETEVKKELAELGLTLNMELLYKHRKAILEEEAAK